MWKLNSNTNENLFRLDDIKPFVWYHVLIGYSDRSEIRSGECIRGLIRTDHTIKVLGETGQTLDASEYLRIEKSQF